MHKSVLDLIQKSPFKNTQGPISSFYQCVQLNDRKLLLLKPQIHAGITFLKKVMDVHSIPWFDIRMQYIFLNQKCTGKVGQILSRLHATFLHGISHYVINGYSLLQYLERISSKPRVRSYEGATFSYLEYIAYIFMIFSEPLPSI